LNTFQTWASYRLFLGSIFLIPFVTIRFYPTLWLSKPVPTKGKIIYHKFQEVDSGHGIEWQPVDDKRQKRVSLYDGRSAD
jgi:hypothetical protein